MTNKTLKSGDKNWYKVNLSKNVWDIGCIRKKTQIFKPTRYKNIFFFLKNFKYKKIIKTPQTENQKDKEKISVGKTEIAKSEAIKRTSKEKTLKWFI